MSPCVHLIDHPPVQHKPTLMRRKDASTNSFRTLLGELSMLLAYEVTRDVVVVVDPMLAIGNSAIAAVERLKETNPKSIKFVCLLTCPEGIAALHNAHPDVPIYTAAIDRQLNEHGCILPGLGDAGDRIFRTQ